MLSRVSLTLDAVDPELLANFWKLAAGYDDEPPPAPFLDRRSWLRALGEPVPDDAPIGAAWLVDPRGVAPRLSILGVPEHKSAKNRLHMDVAINFTGPAEDRWTAVEEFGARLVEAGATLLRSVDRHHVVLADPEGNEFCVL